MCSTFKRSERDRGKGFCLIGTLIECFEAAVTVRSVSAATVRVLAGSTLGKAS
jgi:hypothetical protein